MDVDLADDEFQAHVSAKFEDVFAIDDAIVWFD